MATAGIMAHNPGMGAARQGPSAAAQSIFRLLPLVLLFYSTMSPPEAEITISGQTIFAHRLVLLLSFPWLIHTVVTGGVKFRWVDLVVFVGALWMVVSFVAFYGLEDGLLRGGALALDNFLPYMVARAAIRSLADVRRFLVLIAPGVIALGLIVMVESVSHRQIVRPFAASIFGAAPNYEGGIATGTGAIFTEVRLGLLRAAGPFSHPIMVGVFLGSLLPIYLLSGLRRWPFYLGVAGCLLAFFSVSSAALLAIILGLLLVGYHHLGRFFPFATWRMLALATATFALVAQVATQSGLINILIRLTLNPQTGQYRRLIWEYGIKSMNEHPLFGIGFTAFDRLPWMIASVDTQWLSIGIKHGYITPVCYVLAPLIVLIQLFSRSGLMPNKVDRALLVGLAIGNLSVVILGFTVAFFGGLLVWVFALLGLSAAAAHFVESPASQTNARLKGLN